MNALLPYVVELERHLNALHLSEEQWEAWCDSCLDGTPSRELRRLVPLADLKEQGAFFTAPGLARQVATTFGASTDDESVYCDPACGVGDLLLAVASGLPLAPAVSETLALWGRRLTGCDLSAVFVRAAKARLALLAMQRCGSREPIAPAVLDDLLPAITVGDALRCHDLYSAADRIIMNPPFRTMSAPEGCEWSAGGLNAAAVFTETAIVHSRDGTRIAAILPDVLRSGSRYERWRRMVDDSALLEEVRTYGPFDLHADVDVFLLCMTVDRNGDAHSRSHGDWSWIATDLDDHVSKHFTVRVGAVVPHRDPETGPEYPYVHSRSLPPWSTLERIAEKRSFAGTVFRPPFVAVRRTSGPRDRNRAVATIVLGEQCVAVENHVIVCRPADGSIARCRALLERLRSSKTDEWLNRRIRCRHLTTASVAEIPWWDDP
ncbi:MAG: SAM-dependent DNA methyltransferase [Gammaproteobacteria bacterium]|nr:SAM-dependent DNA methyltransferase [Gammaproteobacteria bacterium]